MSVGRIVERDPQPLGVEVWREVQRLGNIRVFVRRIFAGYRVAGGDDSAYVRKEREFPARLCRGFDLEDDAFDFLRVFRRDEFVVFRVESYGGLVGVGVDVDKRLAVGGAVSAGGEGGDIDDVGDVRVQRCERNDDRQCEDRFHIFPIIANASVFCAVDSRIHE